VAPAALSECMRKDATTWIDIRGLADEGILRAVAGELNIHPLALEDVVNVPQRPKAEEYDQHQLVILRMAMLVNDMFKLEQVALLIGKTYVATFQERDGDVFDPVRARVRQGRGPIRDAGAGYLGYALIDTVIDGYYPVLEHLGDVLAGLEDEVIERPSSRTVRRIYDVKRQLLELRRAVWPHRDVINSLVRDETKFISAETRLYLRDTADHAVQLLDVLEAYRETISGLLDVYLSSESNRTNEVMRVLTVIASIFIPLTFLAGVYGMNFEAMPELHSRIGYPLVLGAMVVIAGGLLWKFHQLGWIGSRKDDSE
jgi:magnesium transporter